MTEVRDVVVCAQCSAANGAKRKTCRTCKAIGIFDMGARALWSEVAPNLLALIRSLRWIP